MREVSVSDSGHDFHNAAHLLSQVDGHDVDVVRKILPGSGDTGHLRLTAKFAVGTDFARHARDFCGEGVELVHHRVNGVLQFENLAFHVHRDLARQIAAGHSRRDFGNVSHLTGQVAGHGVHGVSKILPCSGDAGHVCLSAQPAFGAHFTGHARDFGGERSQLLDHRIQRLFELQNFAAHVDGDLFRKVTISDSGCHFSNVTHLARKVAGHEVHVVGEILPRSGDAGHLCLTAQLAVGTDFAGHARDFSGEGVELVHHRVDRILEFENFAFHIDRNLARQIATGHGRGHFGDVSNLASQVPGHRVNRVREILPRSSHAGDVCLSAQSSFGTHFASDARDFAGERVELIDHRVDGFFEQQNFAAHVDRNFLG